MQKLLQTSNSERIHVLKIYAFTHILMKPTRYIPTRVIE